MLNKAVGACGERLILSATDKEDQQLSQFLPLVHGSYPQTETTTSKTYTLRSIVGELRRELASGNSSNPEHAALGLARLAAAGVPGAAPSSWYGLLPVSTTSIILSGLPTILYLCNIDIKNVLVILLFFTFTQYSLASQFSPQNDVLQYDNMDH
jgi:hypothetical protein